MKLINLNSLLILMCLFFSFFITSCSGIRMERPEPKVYETLKSEKLFGIWESSNSRLKIACTGRVEFLETREGQEFNKDEGGKVSEIYPDKSQFVVSSIFGSSKYHYQHLDEVTLELLVGERPSWMEGLKVADSYMTMIPQEEKLRLKRKTPYDCDSEPVTLNEVFKDMSDKLKKGEFEVVNP